MKVVFFAAGILEAGGGCEKYFREVSTGLATRYPDFEISIVTLNEKFFRRLNILKSFYYLQDFFHANLRAEQTEMIRQALGRVSYIQCDSWSDLAKSLKMADVIYAKNEYVEAAILRFCIGYHQLPRVIFGCHTPLHYPMARSIHARFHNYLYHNWFYRWLGKHVSRFHAINSTDERKLQSLFGSERVVKIYNPFDFQMFRQQDARFPFPFDRTRRNVLWVGRLTEQKGVDDLVAIVRGVNQIVERDVVWNICGSGPEKNKIERLKHQWSNVNYLGYVEQRYMPSIYRQNDLFLSTSHWEGFPYNLLEAQACGLPVCAYDIGGCCDIIDPPEHGRLAKTCDQLQQDVQDLIQHLQISTNIASSIAQKFDAEKIYEQLHQLLKDVSYEYI